jgi:alanine dehydrogenase
VRVAVARGVENREYRVAALDAARIAAGLGAAVTVLGIDTDRLRHVDELSSGRLQTRTSNTLHITEAVGTADLVIGAVPATATDALANV